MKICISTESTADLSAKLIKENDISIIPFSVTLGDETGRDGIEITPTRIFEFVEETGVLPKTSAVNEYSYTVYFEELLTKYDAVVHLSLSSQLSSSYNNACSAAKNFNNVYVIDSRSLSTGIGLQVLFAAKLARENKEPKDIVKLVLKRQPYVQASFVVNTLNYLHKGGRCSGLTKVFGTLLRIKPQIIVNSEGKMVPGKKYIGRSTKCVISYCQDTLEQFNNIDKELVFITHSHAVPEMIDCAREALTKLNITNIEETVAGATITSHCGPKTLGILYYNDGAKY